MKTIREIYGEALAELGAENKNIVVLDCDVSSSTRSELFAKAYPERFFNFGIAEGNMAAAAAGMALAGKTAFINTFAFLLALRAADPIHGLIAHGNLNVKIMGAYAGLSDSYDGASHQSAEDIAVMRAIPNMTAITVCDGYQTRAAVRACADYPGPVYVRLSRNEMPDVYKQGGEFKIGRANILKRGSDVTLIGCGLMTSRCIAAAEELKTAGINAEVIDMHTVKPFDRPAVIESVGKTGAAVAAEEHSVIGGLGSAVAETLAAYFPAPLEMVGIADKFGESGEYAALLEKYGLGVNDIVNAAKRVILRKRG